MIPIYINFKFFTTKWCIELERASKFFLLRHAVNVLGKTLVGIRYTRKNENPGFPPEYAFHRVYPFKMPQKGLDDNYR